ncbi:ABC transporter permease [Leekyejoonella antrihumi]|uniref:ABC transporter permease n=1 Tax=Leekyejoonella antrihumi TaxID=1660198 RepID=A0A563E8W7_9MICO|nr:ABC transporter permease [Leekyejoonella antrihumi]TWP38960.1 ABC transporter permease [Leekyejoonella antrihumi]
MSTQVEDPARAEAGTPARTGRRRRLGREDLGMLLGLPLLVIVVFAAWVLWRQTAILGPIEKRQLAWSVIGELTWQHVKLTVVAAIAVLVTAVPIGIILTRPKFRRLAPPVAAVANAGQAAPVIGVIVLLAIWIGFGFWTAVLSLGLYAFLPVLRNTIVGLQQVDPNLVEAARGMGLSQFAVLRRIELPLAIPVIMAGVRVALVLLVGTASFATFINAGGLGALITTGITLFRYPILISGALLIALLALIFDWLGRVLETAATPKGM